MWTSRTVAAQSLRCGLICCPFLLVVFLMPEVLAWLFRMPPAAFAFLACLQGRAPEKPLNLSHATSLKDTENHSIQPDEGLLFTAPVCLAFPS